MISMKKILAMLFIVFTAGFVQADVLYWMLSGKGSDSFLSAYNQALAQAPDLPNDGPKTVVARLFTTDLPAGSSGTISSAATRSYIKDSESSTSVVAVEYNGKFENKGMYADIGSDSASGLAFGVELGILNADNSITALYISEVVSYGTLSEMGAIQQMTTVGYDKVWNAANLNYVAVPEPASGVLILFGCSVLLIRRKRYA